MRPLSTFLLLSILAFASACSKSNYAQVEPDDLYFTHKDRKATEAYYNSSANNVTADASYDYSGSEVSGYTNQHSPTLQSTTLGSPTIQQYEETFYDASQNPDYLIGQDIEYVDGVSDAYYMDDYESYNTANTTPEPQVVNNYYGYDYNGYGYSPYYSNRYRGYGAPYSSFYRNSPFSFSIGYGYGPYSRNSFNSYYDHPAYYYHNGYLYYSYSAYYATPYYNGGYNYCYNPIIYSDNNYYSGSNYNASQVITAPRTSRSSVSYYANKRSYDSPNRRDNFIPTHDGGRILSDDSGNRYKSTARTRTAVDVDKRYSQGDNVVKRRGATNRSSGTIQRNSSSPTRYSRSNSMNRERNDTRTKRSVNSSSPTQRQTRTNVNQSTNRRSTTVNRTNSRQSTNNNSNRSGRTRTSISSNSRSNSSYSRPKTNSSYKAPSRSSSNRSSYSPRSSSSSRSSYSPSRSSSQRSSGSSSNNNSSKRSSGKRKR